MINHQSTNLNLELITIATPLFDNNGTLEYILMSVWDSIHQVHLDPSKDILLPEQNSKKLSMIAESANMKGILNSLKKLGRTDAICTFVGESGTVKIMLARYCHENSLRQKNLFWDVPKGTKSLTITKKSEILAVNIYSFKVCWLYHNNLRIKVNLKGLTPVIHRYQALNAA